MEQMNYGGMQGKGQKNNIGEKTEKDDNFAKVLSVSVYYIKLE